ncbi:MAG: ankyrin repeat domain-containing protein [Paracoccaceae bacterium]
MLGRGVKTINDLTGQMIRYLIVFLVVCLLGFLFFILLPILFVWSIIQRWLGIGPEPTGQDVVGEYEGLIEAMKESDLPFLERYKASVPSFPHCTDGFIDRRWLINAIDCGSLDSVRWVLDQGVEVEYYDDEGYSPLTSAIDREAPDNADVVALLLDRGANVNAKGTLDVTPLHIAAARGNGATVQILLDHGADPFAFDSDYTPTLPITWVDSKKGDEISIMLRTAMDATKTTQ